MDDNMNVAMSSGPSIDAHEVVRLVETLYNSNDSATQNEANRRLTELQARDEMWQICWQLLDLNQCRSSQIHFFAAQVLVLKINQNWVQSDKEWLEHHLRPKLFETLAKFASSPDSDRIVIDRLSLALANFALRSIPRFWPNAIEEILQSFQPQNLPVNISPQRICDILLKILLFIPEEYSVLITHQEHRAKLNEEMTRAGPIVFRFLHSILMTDSNTVSSECKQNVLKCLASWTLHSRSSLLEMDEGKQILDLLFGLILDEELCAPACSALGSSFISQKADNYQNTIISYIPKMASLKPVIEKFIKEDDFECAIKIYSLVINFSENHSRLFLKIVLHDRIELSSDMSETVKQSIFTIIKIVLDCTSTPGIYGIDEKCSDIAFSFWLSFFENFYYYSDSFNDLVCSTFDPLVDSLLQILISKSRYPPTSIYNNEWNDDQRDVYRCYRQDLGDNLSLIVHFPRARDRIIASLRLQLEHELNEMLQANLSATGERPWQGFESIVFALKSIGEAIPYDQATHIPEVFSCLARVPFDDSNSLLYCTVAEMISAYSDWLFNHVSHLGPAFKVLFLGVNSRDSHVRLMSTLSLKDLTSECRIVLPPYARDIVQHCIEAILRNDSRLTTNERKRLMHTVGTCLAVSPVDFVETSLNALTVPLLCDMGNMVQLDAESNPNCRGVILDRLVILNSLVESLYIRKSSGNEYEHEDYDENDAPTFDTHRFDTNQDVQIIQPALGLLRQMMPILNAISAKYRHDEELMDIISDTVKRSAKSLNIDLKPLLKDLLVLVVNSYDPLVTSSILDGSLPLHNIFSADTDTHEYFKETFVNISAKTVQVCLNNSLQQLSVTIENYFRYANLACKKIGNLIIPSSSNINVELLYKMAIASLELPEKKTLAEVCNFLTVLRRKCFDSEEVHRIFVSQIDLLLVNIFNIFGGVYSTPRNAIDPVTDLIYHMFDMDEVKAPLNIIVDKENFPTNFVDRERKAKFVSKLFHERHRRKFKDACTDFVLVARNLNRS